MDYQTFRSVTKPSYKQQTLHGNSFAEHNYNYVKGPKTAKPKTNTQIFAQSQNIPQPNSNSVNFYDQPQASQEQSENYPFFNKVKIKQINTISKINFIIMHEIIFHQMMKNTITKIIEEFTQAKDLVLTVLTNPIFSNHTHEMKKYDIVEIIQHLTTIISNNKIQLTHNHTNQLKCITKFHCRIIYNNTN